MRVFVYFNLHKKLFSVRDVSTGLVVAHWHHLTLSNATFKVSEAGRQRVLREKRKNVHAGVEGTLVSYHAFINTDLFARRVTYNPYKGPTFVHVDNQEPCMYAPSATLSVANNVPAIYTL